MYLPNTRSIFKLSILGLNSDFSFLTDCLLRLKIQFTLLFTHNWGEKTVGFMPFPAVLIQNKMQAVNDCGNIFVPYIIEI